MTSLNTSSRSSRAAAMVGTGCIALLSAGLVHPEEPYLSWKRISIADGLPSDQIHAVRTDRRVVWAGTDAGLAQIDRKNGKVLRVWGEKDGLPGRRVSSIDVDPDTGDVWVGLLGEGLARLSGGHFDHWHQLNSGLLSNVVYGVSTGRGRVWAATQAGVSFLDLSSGSWTVFDQRNAPAEAGWSPAIRPTGTADRIWLGVWGGLLEYTLSAGEWAPHRLPSVSGIVTGLDEIEGVTWVSTLDGAWRVHGGEQRHYRASDGGLPSDRVECVRARGGDEAWFGTDEGLAVFVGPDTWIRYMSRTRSVEPAVTRMRGEGSLQVATVAAVGFPDNRIAAIDLGDTGDVWLATARGVGWGKRGHTDGTEAVGLPAPEVRDAGGPGAAQSLKVGFIGPILASASASAERRREEREVGIPMLNGARLAVEQWNDRGGWRQGGVPFALVAGSDLGLWGSGSNDFVRLADREGVLGIVGSMGGGATYTLTRLADLLEVPFVNAGDDDPRYSESGAAWALGGVASVRQQAETLLAHLAASRRIRHLGVIDAATREGRRASAELLTVCSRLGARGTVVEYEYVEDTGVVPGLDRLRGSGVDAIVHWGEAADGGRIVKCLRQWGMRQPFATSERALSMAFATAAGDAVRGAICASSWDPRQHDLAAFRRDYERRYGQAVSSSAANGYRNMDLLLRAIDAVGVDRAQIRRWLAGKSGSARVLLARWHKGEWLFFGP